MKDRNYALNSIDAMNLDDPELVEILINFRNENKAVLEGPARYSNQDVSMLIIC